MIEFQCALSIKVNCDGLNEIWLLTKFDWKLHTSLWSNIKRPKRMKSFINLEFLLKQCEKYCMSHAPWEQTFGFYSSSAFSASGGAESRQCAFQSLSLSKSNFLSIVIITLKWIISGFFFFFILSFRLSYSLALEQLNKR